MSDFNCIFPSRAILAQLFALLLLLVGSARPAEAAWDPSQCKVNGGNDICTVPFVSEWDYGLCDGYSYVSRYRTWCEVKGGTWVVSDGGNYTCEDQGPVTESNLVSLATEFEWRYQGACQISHTDTGWPTNGETYEPPKCWTSGPQYILGLEYFNLRGLDFSGLREDSAGDCTEPWSELIVARRGREVRCPAGFDTYIPSSGHGICYREMADFCPVGTGTAPGLGAQHFTESDIEAPEPNGLGFTRHYNSQGFYRPTWEDDFSPATSKDFWRHNYSQKLHFNPDATGPLAIAVRPNGSLKHFESEGLETHVKSEYGFRLESVANEAPVAWRLVTPDNVIEQYDAAGRLLAINHADGKRQELTYQGGLLVSVSDQSGRMITLDYGSDGKLTSVTDPNGRSINYTYDELSRLTKASYDDGTSREYLHELTYDNLYAVTGIVDEKGNRYATIDYGGYGKVSSFSLAGGADQHDFTYIPHQFRNYVYDPFGTKRQVRYQEIDGVLRPTTWDKPCDQCEATDSSIGYYSDGQVKSRIDFNGNKTTYTYNAAGLESSRTEAVGTAEERTVTTTWDSDLRLPLEIVDGDRKTTFTYDARGRTLSRTVTDLATGAARTWNYTYCTQADTGDPAAYCPVEGLRKSVDGPRSDVVDDTQYFYYTDDAADGSHRVGDLWEVVNAEGHVTEYTAYDPAGRVTEIQGPNGTNTRFAYDARGRLTERRLVDPAGQLDVVTTFTYDAAGNLTRIIRPDGSYLDYTYDAAHRLVAIADASGNRIDYTLDNAGNRTAETVAGPGGTVFSERTRQYNELNRLVKEVNGLAEETVHAYDPEGNRTSIADPAGHATSHQYDALNRLSQTVDALNGVTAYSYDDHDRLTRVSDPRGVATDYAYNAFGDLLREVSPDAGTTTYTYDAAGNRVSRTDARGVTADYQYDALGRLTRIDHTGGETIAYTYDQGTYGKGRLTDIANQTSGDTITYTHDFQGRVIEDRRVISGQTLVTAYEYDPAGRVTALTYPSGARVAIARDADGRPSSVTLTADGVTRALASGIQYAPFGPLSQLTWGHGSVLTRQFDAAGRLTEQQTDGFQHLAWSYSMDGNITALDDLLTPSQSQSFAYDALHRLTSANGAYGSLAYAYDPVGNRTRLTEDGSATDYSYAADSNRLLQAGAESYAYDAMGNAVQRGSLAFSYDAKGRMASVDTGKGQPVTYRVNALGQRSVKTDKKDRLFAYDTAGHLIGEYDDKGLPIREYVYLGDRPLAMVVSGRKGTEIYFMHTDHLGTPKVLTDEAGKVVWDGQYRPFGEVTTSGKVEQPLRFPGQYFDAESGLHYNYYRDYDPGTGRYVESDPIGLGGGLNTYLYVGSNPIESLDRTGQFAVRASEVFSPAKNDYAWRYTFSFSPGCASSALSKFAQKYIARPFRLALKALRLSDPREPAGHPDISNPINRCICENVDHLLKDVYERNGYYPGESLNQKEAEQLLSDFRQELNNRDKNKCINCRKALEIYRWGGVLKAAQQGGQTSIRRIREQ